MSKPIIVFLGILLTGGIGWVSVDKNSSPASTHNLNDLSPTETVVAFWDASASGNEEIVKQLITVSPQSFHEVCEENGKGRSQYGSPNNSETDNSGISLVSEENNEPESINTETKYASSGEHKFMKEASGDSKLALAYITARFIYTSKTGLSRVAVKNELIYKDEAIVQVEYNISTSKMQEQFLLKNQEGWKIFLSAAPDSGSIVNKNYAKPRPKCE
jgi:hypothetical protein